MGNRILITGGAGFVGSNLSRFLSNNGYEVIALDNLKRRGSELNLKNNQDLKNFTFVHGDIRNKEDLASVGKFDTLIDCSAEPSVHTGVKDSPEYAINTNLMGTINCLEEVRKNDANILFLSTSRVYSIPELKNIKLEKTSTRFSPKDDLKIEGFVDDMITEDFSTKDVRSIYGTSKLSSEQFIQEYNFNYGVKGIINRFGVIAGPGQMGKVDQGFFTLWIYNHILNKPLKYTGFGGEGFQVRDVLSVDDLCRLVFEQLQSLDSYDCPIYNVGGSYHSNCSLYELTNICNQEIGYIDNFGSVPETNPLDIPFYISNNFKLYREFDWRPKDSLFDLFQKTHKWVNDNINDLSIIFGDNLKI
jgi:CDP-paratose 2-epimerase